MRLSTSLGKLVAERLVVRIVELESSLWALAHAGDLFRFVRRFPQDIFRSHLDSGVGGTVHRGRSRVVKT